MKVKSTHWHGCMKIDLCFTETMELPLLSTQMWCGSVVNTVMAVIMWRMWRKEFAWSSAHFNTCTHLAALGVSNLESAKMFVRQISTLSGSRLSYFYQTCNHIMCERVCMYVCVGLKVCLSCTAQYSGVGGWVEWAGMSGMLLGTLVWW